MICLRSQMILGVESHSLVQNAPLYSKGSSYFWLTHGKERHRSWQRQTGRLEGKKGCRIPSLEEGEVEAVLLPDSLSEQWGLGQDWAKPSLHYRLLGSKQKVRSKSWRLLVSSPRTHPSRAWELCDGWICNRRRVAFNTGWRFFRNTGSPGIVC